MTREIFETPPEKPTHGHLWIALRQLNGRQDEGEKRDDLAARTMERIERKLDDLAHVVGYSGNDERGALIGAGVAGDLARLKARVDGRFSRDDGRMRYLAGAVAAGGLFIAALWWLIRNRIEEIFH